MITHTLQHPASAKTWRTASLLCDPPGSVVVVTCNVHMMFCVAGAQGSRALPPAGGLRHPGPGPHQPDRGRGGDGDRQLALLQECPETAGDPEPIRGKREEREDTELPGAKKKCEAC